MYFRDCEILPTTKMMVKHNYTDNNFLKDGVTKSPNTKLITNYTKTQHDKLTPLVLPQLLAQD